MDLNALDWQIRRAFGPSDMAMARRLFAAYLRELDLDLSFQDIDRELETLPGPYAEPQGTILLAEFETQAVGIVALKALPALGDGVCEMKRLFIGPSRRGLGLSAALCRALEDEARARGYRLMKLDTLARLDAANRLYRKLGYQPCAPYNHNPFDDVRYFEKIL
ncbi:putative N-acetyltransferase.07c [alpha proteobacterium Q-1]|uniref:GNAT family N-acetyltransferase n=1 Tax=Iodidimonas nitroreducens TaxID=1236968 RepID=UPI00049ECC04|nr:GNAT family N-acetyltransferase [Iodidimonas nitroreducens]GAK32685.1 putative N-acetyltransferase.07c [alpha proteobacterium Q-1]